MKILILLIAILGIINCEQSTADYLPVTEAHTALDQIKKESIKFKELIEAKLLNPLFYHVFYSVTKEFNSCVDLMTTNQCNLIDQWQAEIEKCKLENDNSINVEVPFIKERKTNKVARLKKLIELGKQYSDQMMIIVDQLKLEQGDFHKSNWEIHQLYKLPQEIQTSLFQKNKQIDVVRQLNANIPRVAEDEVKTAKIEYERGDISIQAQTVSEEMISAYDKLDQTLQSLKQEFDLRQAEIKKEKDQIKEDIIRLRALMDQEVQVQNKNLERITELEAKILACEKLPTNSVKDCAPIKVSASKMQTEMDILEARTSLLFKEIEKLMNDNQNEQQIGDWKDLFKGMKEAEAARSQEESFLHDEDPTVGISAPPQELKPKHHLKEKVN